jgi:hypothetical protein
VAAHPQGNHIGLPLQSPYALVLNQTIRDWCSAWRKSFRAPCGPLYQRGIFSAPPYRFTRLGLMSPTLERRVEE